MRTGGVIPAVAYRNDIEALEARKAALDAQVRDVTRERDDAARLLDETRARMRLPVLPNIRTASPCKQSWASMQGDDRVRHCGACDKDVFNLSALTAEQAEALIRDKAGDLCGRYFQRKDGTILLADCEVGARRTRRRRGVLAAGLAMTLASGAAYMHAAQDTIAREDQHEVVGLQRLPTIEELREELRGMETADHPDPKAIEAMKAYIDARVREDQARIR